MTVAYQDRGGAGAEPLLMVNGLGGVRYAAGMRFIWHTSQLRFPNTLEGDEERAIALTTLIASPGYPFDEDAVRAQIAEMDVSGYGNAKAQARQIGAHWRGPRLSELRAPTLVLIGDADRVMKYAAARDLADAVDGAKLVILPGVGHDLPAALWPTLAHMIRGNAERWAPAPSSVDPRRESCDGA